MWAIAIICKGICFFFDNSFRIDPRIWPAFICRLDVILKDPGCINSIPVIIKLATFFCHIPRHLRHQNLSFDSRLWFTKSLNVERADIIKFLSRGRTEFLNKEVLWGQLLWFPSSLLPLLILNWQQHTVASQIIYLENRNV